MNRLLGNTLSTPGLDVHAIVRRTAGGSKIYAVPMILGSPYRRLIGENGPQNAAADEESREGTLRTLT